MAGALGDRNAAREKANLEPLKRVTWGTGRRVREMAKTSEFLEDRRNSDPHSSNCCREKYQVKNATARASEQVALTLVELHKENNYELRAPAYAHSWAITYGRLCHELGRTYEVDDRSVLSKKRGLEDRDQVVELGCEGK
ncbi:hypothetical protein Tco_0860062 [Tanacetum coccineum]|uniref:Uncharacterized protein n=1 Tax=Tanacetum coccineum TaxID=301880 RepID=A0ABQ5BDU3_9ASTR